MIALFRKTEFWHISHMTTIPLEKARNDLPGLVERALAGEEIVIATPGATGVKLSPFPLVSEQVGDASYRGRGVLKGKLVVGPEFFEPLSDEECGCGDGTSIREDAARHPCSIVVIRGRPAFPKHIESLVDDSVNTIFVSAASAWEFVRKSGLASCQRRKRCARTSAVISVGWPG